MHYITLRQYKVQVKIFTDHNGVDVWQDIGVPSAMTTCKIMRSFLSGADEPMTCRTLFVGEM